MITEWLISLATGMVSWIVQLFPEWEPPEWLIDADGMVMQVFTFFDGLSPWIDWSFVGLIAAVPFAVWAGVLLFKGIRALIAHVPFVGGKG